MNIDSTKYLFVYGSLKRGFSNPFSEYLNHFLRFYSTGKIEGKLYLIDWYPGAVLKKGEGSTIYGEVYEVINNDVFQFLDEYEGIHHDSSDFYNRKIVEVTTSNGCVHSWFYEYIGSIDNKPSITTGVFE